MSELRVKAHVTNALTHGWARCWGMANEGNRAELGALEKAVNEAAGRVGALWLTFLTLATFLVITVGSVTHQNLLLETPLRLPILNVDLPLVGFFVVAPAFFLVFHFYLFLQLYGLSAKTSAYDKLLKDQDLPAADQRLMRLHLDGFIFVQILAGGRRRNDKAINVLPSSVAWITVVAVPLVVLLMIQVRFLPYHSEPVTWFHRLVIGLDVILVLLFWPRVSGRARLVPKVGFTLGAACAVLLVANVVAIFPGETIYEIVRTPLTRLLFEGNVGAVTGQPQSLFANRLAAPDQRLIKTDDFQNVERTVSFRGRDLRGAVLSRSDLRKADFTGATLVGAVLTEANLELAQFGCADKQRVLGCTDMRSANFTGARMAKARLDDGRLEGASFLAADLRASSLTGASLAGADFRSARLEDADLTSASLAGASFDNARLERATFDAEDFSGASAIDAIGLALSDTVKDVWTASSEAAPLDDPTREELSKRLEKLGCDPDNPPHIARGLIRSYFLTHAGTFLVPVAEKFKSARASDCHGATGLTDEDLLVLKDQLAAARSR
jgi:hypothetical protein